MSTDSDLTGALLAAAQNYRSRGWLPIQLHHLTSEGACSCRAGASCNSKGKHPINARWQDSARPSGADIQALWDDRPAANIGIATGPASAIWVLDIDPKGNGLETMKGLTAEHGRLPETFTVRTGSGGYHYYFALEVGLRNSQGRVGPGVDVRADGGQVVAAPSRTDRGVYTVIKDVPVARAPEWLLELARKPERDDIDTVTAEDLPRPEEIEPAEWDRLTSYAKKAIEAELGRLDKLSQTGWDGEPWDLTTFEVACCLIEFANSPWNAYSIGQAQADLLARAPRDDEGFDDWKVKQKFSSARERVGNKARAIPQSQTRPNEPDPLFSSPDVRGRRGPTEGGDGPTTPTVGGGGHDRFFNGPRGEIDYVMLRDEILAAGPIGWGRDKDFWAYEKGVWRPDEDVVERRAVELLGPKYRDAHTSNVETMVKHRATRLNGDPISGYMNFTNGMLDWATGDLLGHDPNFKSTIQFPVAWEPDATCPTFDQFLSDVMHPDYVRLAWEMIGYLMYSGNPLQVAFLFYGTGGNGKGTLMRVIQNILGDENVANEPLDRLNGDRFSAVNLYGKIANLAGDIDATYQESTAAFKRLTGEDEVAAERKFGQRFVFENWAVPLFSANKIPGSSDVTEGYLRRWVVLHFHKRITNPVRGLSNLLATETEGIAAKAVVALRTLMERGEFDLSGEAAKGREEFAETIDQVRQWVKHGGPRAATAETVQALSELYFEYSVWANKTGQGRLREQEFSHRLESIGFERLTQAGMVFHRGIHVSATDRPGATPSSFFG